MNVVPVRQAANALLAILATVAVLAGCVSPQVATRPVSSAEVETAFMLNGRFSVRTGKDSGTGRIAWQHTLAQDDLTLLTPIGTGLARLERRDGLYTLETADGRRASDRDPDALTEQLLGWRLPIAGLPFWVRARARPGVAFEVERDESRRVTSMQQSGWLIEYPSYFDNGELPRQIRMRRDPFDIRLVLDEWQPIAMKP